MRFPLLALVVAVHTFSAGEALAGKCDSVKETLKSLVSEVPVTVVFRNATDIKINVIWLDFNGEGQLYKQLKPGQQYQQKTFVTHPWGFFDGATCIDFYMPDPSDNSFTIRK